MSLKIIAALLLPITFMGVGCSSSLGNYIGSTEVKNDTTAVVDLAVKTAFYYYNLPDIDAVMKPYRFKDSVLFTADSLPLTLLPKQFDTIPFKILPKEQICTLLIADSLLPSVPNFLFISRLEKQDTGYYVQVQSRSCLPFGGGGAIGIYIGSRNDSFYVKRYSASSIN